MRRANYLLTAVAVLACDSSPEIVAPPLSEITITAEQVAQGLSSPVYVTAPAGDARLFVVEQPGRIRIVQSGQLVPTPFLDITSRVSSGGERGLLSVAFHPQYAANGFFFVNFTDLGGNTRIERFTVSADRNVANPASSKLILGIAQPFANHNGGLNLFGPDGMLYIGMGDGGSAGDPLGHGQNRNTLLGALLRIDVDRGDPYAIPANNPYVGQTGARGEIWAIGLRNPWRFSFDAQSGLLFIADVGQNRFEEVNVVQANRPGVNYGWNIMEASSCYNSATCVRDGLQLPAVEYDHSGGACSVTGVFVYRGRLNSAALAGHYFYSDFCAAGLRSFRVVNGAAVDHHTWDLGNTGSVTSFGQDGADELYFTSTNGRVYRIVTSPRAP